jgi:hypothetical protein
MNTSIIFRDMPIQTLIRFCLLGVAWLVFPFMASAQKPATEKAMDTNEDIVEVAGLAFTQNEKGRPEPAPFLNIFIKGTNRVAYTNYDGMFAVVVKKGQTIQFSGLGFGTREITVPKDYPSNRMAITVEMMLEEINLDAISVFPWPNRNNLTAEFLAMQSNSSLQMQAVAEQNLKEKNLRALQNLYAMDSKASATYYLQQQARTYSSMGQVPQTPIFDAMAWARYLKQNKEKKKAAKKEED